MINNNIHIPIKLTGNSVNDLYTLIAHYRKQILNEKYCSDKQIGYYKGYDCICKQIELILEQNKL